MSTVQSPESGQRSTALGGVSGFAGLTPSAQVPPAVSDVSASDIHEL